MLLQKKSSQRFFQTFLTLLTIVLMIAVGIVRAIHPSLHMDESLYLGAALRMLHGDPLLTTYWLDKIPLASILMIPGILIAGENSLGFHLSGLIAATTGVLGAQSLIRDVVQRPTQSFFAQFFYLSISLAPFMVFHHASAFTDPFLFLFLILFLRSAWRCLDSSEHREEQAYEKKVYLYFTLSLLVKFSAVMWVPVLLGFWLLKYGPRWWKDGPRRFAYHGRYLWLGALVYMLANPGKLAPILWFNALLTKSPDHIGHGQFATLFDRVVAWTEVATTLLGARVIFFALTSLIVILSSIAKLGVLKSLRLQRPTSLPACYDFVRRSPVLWSRFILLFLAPFWAHALGLCLSGANLFPRYLYIIVPQLGLALIFGWYLVSEIRVHSPRRALALRSFASAGFGVMVLTGLFTLTQGFDFERQWSFVTTNTHPPESGRELYKIRDELPRRSVIHHNSRLWFLYPFIITPEIRPACQETTCLVDSQIGRAPFDRQYLFAESSDHLHWEVEHIEPQQNHDAPFHFASLASASYEIPLKELLTVETTRQNLRIFGWAKDLSWSLGSCPSCRGHTPLVTSSLPSWAMLQSMPDMPATLTISLKNNDQLSLPQAVQVGGHFTLTRGVKSNPYRGDDRWFLAFRLEQVNIGASEMNLVDLIPILFGSYIVPFGPIDIPETPLGSFGSIVDLALKNSANDPKLVAKFVQQIKRS